MTWFWPARRPFAFSRDQQPETFLLSLSFPFRATRDQHRPTDHTSTAMASLVTASIVAPLSSRVSFRGFRSQQRSASSKKELLFSGREISSRHRGIRRQCRAVASRPEASQSDATQKNLDDVIQQLESNVIELGPGKYRAHPNPRRLQPPLERSCREKRFLFFSRKFSKTVFSTPAKFTLTLRPSDLHPQTAP